MVPQRRCQVFAVRAGVTSLKKGDHVMKAFDLMHAGESIRSVAVY
ncbi:MAG: hypothetical protein ACREVR_06605 [Burkholderiales bacterium]